MLKKLVWLIVLVNLNTVVRAQLQSISVVADKTEICEGGSAQLSAVISTVGTLNLEVLWSPDQDISSVDVLKPIVSPKVTTVYKVVIYDVDNDIRKNAEIVISVIPKPIVVAPADWSVCTNEPIELKPIQFDNSDKPTWTHNGAGTFEDNLDELSVTYMPASNELGEVQFILVGHGIGLCDSVSDTTIVTFAPATTAEITNVEEFICGDTILSLTGSAENYDSISWTHDGKGILTDLNTLSPTYTPGVVESGKVNIVLQAFGKVCDKSDTFSFEVSPIQLEFNNEITACQDDRVMLNIVSLNSVSYLWNTGEVGSQIMVDAISSGVYVAEVTNDKNCKSEAVIRVDVQERPYLYLSADKENKVLTASPKGLASYEFYDKSSGDLLYSGSSNIFDYSSVSVYVKEIQVIGVNETGCKSEDENSDGSNIFIIPRLMKVNAFSPNGDGINDRLLPGQNIRVLDRTHKILYEGWDGWDGTYNGKSMPQGTYFYMLFDGNDIYYKGPVTILR